MFNKKFKVNLSACIAAVMLFGTGLGVFADTPLAQEATQDTVTLADDLVSSADPNASADPSASSDPDASASPDASADPSPSADPSASPSTTPEPVETTLDIVANYTQPSENDQQNYLIKLTAKDMPEFVAFDLKVSFTDAEVGKASVSEALLRVGEQTGPIRSNSDVTFRYDLTDPSAPLQGVQSLCEIEIDRTDNNKPDAENIVIDELTLTTAEGGIINVTPELSVQAGEYLEEPTEEEQEVLDLIFALPSRTTISFYDADGELVLLNTLSQQVSAAKTAYNRLTDKTNVDQHLAANMINPATLFTTLEDTISAMNDLAGVLQIANNVKDADADTVLNYEFLLNVFKKVDVKDTALSGATKAYSEFNAAKEAISQVQTLYDTAVVDAEDEDLVDALEEECDLLKKLGTDKYYEEYLDELIALAEALEDEVSSSYRARVTDVLDELNSLVIEESDLPTFSVGSSITYGSTYRVSLSGKSSSLNTTATVEVIVRNASGDIIAQKSDTMGASERSMTITMPYARDGFTIGRTVTVEVTFEVNGVVRQLKTRDGDELAECTVYRASTSSSNGNHGPSGSNVYNPIGNGTTYPSASPSPSPSADPDGNEQLFNDIDNYDWAKESIEGLYYAGIVNGMEEHVFNPAGEVTREQFAKMVVQLFNIPLGDTASTFEDVDPNQWYAPYITAAVNAGFIQGQSDTYFGIGESIMRQDMATILYRALGDRGEKAELSFTDSDNIASYATEAVKTLVGLGVINGYSDNTFLPRGTATRAEAAKMIWGVYNILEEDAEN